MEETKQTKIILQPMFLEVAETVRDDVPIICRKERRYFDIKQALIFYLFWAIMLNVFVAVLDIYSGHVLVYTLFLKIKIG